MIPLGAPESSRLRQGNRWRVGWGVVPRGEVGHILAFVGKSLGVVPDAAFSVIVTMLMLTTLITPPILGFLLRDRPRAGMTEGKTLPRTSN